MKKISSLELSQNLFSLVFENFRRIKNQEDFQNLIPYRIVEVKDEILKIEGPIKLPKDFFEVRYYLFRTTKILATIDTGYHKSEGLANFNTMIESTSAFIIRDFNSIRKNILKYIQTNTRCGDWNQIGNDNYYLIIKELSLLLSIRLTENWISISIIELKYSGYELMI